MKGHKYSRKPNCPISKAIRKYGWENFKKEVIEEVEDIELLEDRETFFIDRYNSTNRSIGYNILRKNLSKYKGNHPEEVRKRMSQVVKKRYIDDPNLGKKMTRGIREKFLPTIIKPVKQVNLSTGETTIWKSMQEAADTLGIDRACISRVARKILIKNRLGNYHPLRSYKGCDWSLVENQQNETTTDNNMPA